MIILHLLFKRWDWSKFDEVETNQEENLKALKAFKEMFYGQQYFQDLRPDNPFSLKYSDIPKFKFELCFADDDRTNRYDYRFYVDSNRIFDESLFMNKKKIFDRFYNDSRFTDRVNSNEKGEYFIPPSEQAELYIKHKNISSLPFYKSFFETLSTPHTFKDETEKFSPDYDVLSREDYQWLMKMQHTE